MANLQQFLLNLANFHHLLCHNKQALSWYTTIQNNWYETQEKILSPGGYKEALSTHYVDKRRPVVASAFAVFLEARKTWIVFDASLAESFQVQLDCLICLCFQSLPTYFKVFVFGNWKQGWAGNDIPKETLWHIATVYTSRDFKFWYVASYFGFWKSNWWWWYICLENFHVSGINGFKYVYIYI